MQTDADGTVRPLMRRFAEAKAGRSLGEIVEADGTVHRIRAADCPSEGCNGCWKDDKCDEDSDQETCEADADAHWCKAEEEEEPKSLLEHSDYESMGIHELVHLVKSTGSHADAAAALKKSILKMQAAAIKK